MGIAACAIACLDTEFQTQYPSPPRSHHLSDAQSLASQPSLPSVPSLTSSSAPPAHHHCISTLKGHSSYVFTLALAGKHLYSGSHNGHIRSWENDSPSTVASIAKGAIKSMVISGDRLFSAHQDNKIRVWKMGFDGDAQSCKLLATLPTLRDRVLRYLPPKNHVQVRRHKKCSWVHHVDAVSALALSGDATALYSVSWDRSLKVWRAADFTCLESVANAHDDAINAIAVSGDGFVYTGSADTKIKVWRKPAPDQKHSLMATLEKHKSAINALALSADGSVLYSGACDRSIVVWERTPAAHMAVVGALRGHTKAILCLAVVADLVFSGSADKTVRIWRRGLDGGCYSCLGVLEGHRGPVKCLTAASERSYSYPESSDERTSYLIYSGSLDWDIKVWQLSVPSLPFVL